MSSVRVLVDLCVWAGAKNELESAGFVVELVADWDADPGDSAILKYAIENKLSILTLDKDFGELAVRNRTRHSGIVRLVNVPARQQGILAATVMEMHASELGDGAIITVYTNRIRVRPHGDSNLDDAGILHP